MLKITYIAHSSFFIETNRTCLLFDYYTGAIPKVPEGKKLMFLQVIDMVIIILRKSLT